MEGQASHASLGTEAKNRGMGKVPQGCLGCLAFIFLFGALIGVVNFVLNKWRELSADLAPGGNLIWVSAAVFLAFAIWQAGELRRAFRRPTLAQRRSLLCVLAVSVVAFAALVLVNMLAHGSSEGIQVWIRTNAAGILVPAGDSWLLESLYGGLIFSGMIGAILFCFLLLGRLVMGATIAVALHNFFNGKGLDLGVFINTIFDANMPDLLAFLIALAWFGLSMFILKKGPSD